MELRKYFWVPRSLQDLGLHEFAVVVCPTTKATSATNNFLGHANNVGPFCDQLFHMGSLFTAISRVGDGHVHGKNGSVGETGLDFCVFVKDQSDDSDREWNKRHDESEDEQGQPSASGSKLRMVVLSSDSSSSRTRKHKKRRGKRSGSEHRSLSDRCRREKRKWAATGA